MGRPALARLSPWHWDNLAVKTSLAPWAEIYDVSLHQALLHGDVSVERPTPVFCSGRSF